MLASLAPMPVAGTPGPDTVAQLFRHRVPRILLEQGAIEDRVVRNHLAWPHTGFGTHVSRAIPADEKTPGVQPAHCDRSTENDPDPLCISLHWDRSYGGKPQRVAQAGGARDAPRDGGLEDRSGSPDLDP